MMRSIIAATVAALFGLLATNVATADGDQGANGVNESLEISDHFVFNTDTKVHAATVLIRNYKRQQVTATISSSVLDPETAYSIWWAVFNQPAYCVVPFQCGLQDLEINGGNPQVRVSVFYAGGFISDANGYGGTSLLLEQGRTSRERFARSEDYGLQNIRGAEIHVVLRTHGPAGVAGDVADQIGTANNACPPPPPGSPAPNGCANVFTSFHPPRD